MPGPDQANAAVKDNEVRLKTPIKGVDGADINVLLLRKPSPGELRGLQLGSIAMGDVAQITKLIPRIAMPAILETQVAALDLSDFTDCFAIINGFLQK